jgi:hypothetical protein
MIRSVSVGPQILVDLEKRDYGQGQLMSSHGRLVSADPGAG